MQPLGLSREKTLQQNAHRSGRLHAMDGQRGVGDARSPLPVVRRSTVGGGKRDTTPQCRLVWTVWEGWAEGRRPLTHPSVERGDRGPRVALRTTLQSRTSAEPNNVSQ